MVPQCHTYDGRLEFDVMLVLDIRGNTCPWDAVPKEEGKNRPLLIFPMRCRAILEVTRSEGYLPGIGGAVVVIADDKNFINVNLHLF